MKNAKEIKIVIKNHRKEVILETSNFKFKEDLKKNKDKLTFYWGCFVEYEDGEQVAYDYPCNHNGFSPRRVLNVNGRNVNANYNIGIDIYKRDYYKQLCGVIDEDLNGVEINGREKRKWVY